MNQQIELPQLSLQRYVDLVRRRRWQLLPVSLLGLLVGAVVAFLIPRYYVAEATLDYHRVDEGGERGGVDDPFGKIVRSACLSIPFYVGKAMERMKWPEALSADYSVRAQAEKEMRARVFAYDNNPGEKGRDFAQIRVTCRDIDPDRAYTMANAVIDVWKEETVAKLLKQHQTLLRGATEEYQTYDERCTRLIDQIRGIEERYGINPSLPESLQYELAKARREQASRQLDEYRRKDAELKATQAALELMRDDLAKLEPRIKPTLADLLELVAVRPDLAARVQALQRFRDDAEAFPEGSQVREKRERQLHSEEERLWKALPIERDEEGRVPNRRYVELVKKIEDSSRAVALLTREVAGLDEAVRAQQQRDGAQVEGFKELRLNQKDLETALSRRKAAEARMQDHDSRIAWLQSNDPVSIISPARKPPHPTDPNIFVVAIIGAVLGLGVAIGLILLLDLLQGSFKTADDVERGLGLPVLGGMSHLETEEERLSQWRGRRRAASAAFAFVALVVVVVTLYYRAPTKLPTVVRELLDLLLGS